MYFDQQHHLESQYIDRILRVSFNIMSFCTQVDRYKSKASVD